MKIKHLIFTNLGVGIFDLNWLLYRATIFKYTSLASLGNQTNKDFVWYIFIHKDSPNIFKNVLKSYCNTIDLNIVFCEVDGYENIAREINKIKLKQDVDILVTSRIDDDDIVRFDVCEKIKKIYSSNNNKEHILISLKSGADFIPREMIAVNKDYESIALMLTFVAKSKIGDNWPSINEFAHHLVISTLEKQNIKTQWCPIVDASPLFYYVKHPLSDSFYAGAKARIINDSGKYIVEKSNLINYGITEKMLIELSSILEDAPNGVPYKYMEKLAIIRSEIKSRTINKLDTGDLLYKLDSFQNKATRVRNWAKKERKIKVAILGSCVTRDLFAIQHDLGDDFEICFYSARSSIISYMSNPNLNPNLKISDATFEERMSTFDLNKSHWDTLKISQPDIIIVDFIDERIGLINSVGSYFSASGPIVKSFERLGEPFDILRPWNNDIVKLRRFHLVDFFSKLFNISQNIILHKASWSDSYLLDNQLQSFNDTKWSKLIELNNNILSEMFDIVDNNFSLIDSIGGKELKMYADMEHKWGFSPFHYSKEYYASLSKQLKSRIF